MPDIKSKVDEIVATISNPNIKYRTISVHHPEYEGHCVVITIQRDRAGTNMSMQINLQGPVYRSGKELVLESFRSNNCLNHIVDWSHTGNDKFIDLLTKAILWELQLEKLIPYGDEVV